MPSLVRGRIVYPKVAIPDPQGQNPKEGRPFVVISRDEQIQQGGRIQAVGITGERHQSPADHYVPLPHGPTAKSALLAGILALFFGPLGMLYSTVPGAICLFLVNLVFGIPTIGLILLITWPVGIVWAIVAAGNSS